MPKCATCGIDLQGSRCPGCGRDSVASIKAANKQLQKYIYPMFAGLAGILVATRYYPLLDRDGVAWFAMGAFFLPVVVHIVCAVRKRLTSNASRVQTLYLSCGIALVLVFGVAWLNGALDASPVQTIRASVTGKTITSGRHSTSYHLVVSSWRPSRRNENLTVSRDTYHSTLVGDLVVIEIHDGRFGLQWYGQVLAAPTGRSGGDVR